MITLYGIPLSNFFSMTKHAILEKGVEVEFVDCRPGQDPAFLEMSPMGKVPFVKTPDGFLSESTVIMEYLEDTAGGPALMPSDPYEKALVRRLMKTVELYIEAPIHPLVGALFGREVAPWVIENCPAQARRGLGALGRMARFSPWLAGEQFTYADILAFYSLNLSRTLTLSNYEWDLLDDVPGLKDWYELMSERAVTKEVMKDVKAASEALGK